MIQQTLLPHLRAPDNETLVVCALASEIPEALPEVCLFTGVGKINATYSLTRYLSNHPEIKRVINYGTGGGAYKVEVGQLHKCTTFLQGDIDCGDLCDGPGITFGDDTAVSGVINFGDDGLVCRTQDQFVTDIDALDMFTHLMSGQKFNIVDMEAYALAKICASMGKDFHCYKYISDDASNEASDEWYENVSKGEPLFYEVLKKNHGFTHIQ
jgi:adenosylhomocysteine nucleosidase|tara:strand:- start:170 stop:805 length:636 start_codon:yes stop_codon:yes gene_type:complete